ncbi:hypothetical protein [Natronorubrum sulfidifaciens]|uniref:Uncharacterized protein n=1 Tax=Natronorubrum sulfidifaciens JCM 14089 TaxID=1230460 RepID=L9W3K3_9EURY|nr:hypothetical protein [Natronorubrum sulfidifaciens]ELY44054.1 hypothetical protein C495_12080 [Natronorubrum sulfidifaciens JCM 14089]
MTARRTLEAIRSNPRAILWGAAAAVSVFSLFGLVTGLIPNPLYVRMVPRTPTDYLFLTLTALLAGVYTAQRLSTDVVESELEDDDAGTGSEDRWALGGLAGGFLAVGCPICNAFLLALFSSSALMTYFDPLRPLLGVISVALLAGLIYTRHKRTCPTCAT